MGVNVQFLPGGSEFMGVTSMGKAGMSKTP